jgi:carbonic anhydrase/acetyltransferase-like protein (isoleucine patch superfamily)
MRHAILLRNITVGHGAMLHSYTIDDGCLIGMRWFFRGGESTIIKRKLTNRVISEFQKSALHYVELAREYQQSNG